MSSEQDGNRDRGLDTPGRPESRLEKFTQTLALLSEPDDNTLKKAAAHIRSSVVKTWATA